MEVSERDPYGPGGGASGAPLTFTMPLTPGTYELRFFQNNTYTVLATSAPSRSPPRLPRSSRSQRSRPPPSRPARDSARRSRCRMPSATPSPLGPRRVLVVVSRRPRRDHHGVRAIDDSPGSRRQDHTCALKTDGTVVCWGNNSYRSVNRAGRTRLGRTGNSQRLPHLRAQDGWDGRLLGIQRLRTGNRAGRTRLGRTGGQRHGTHLCAQDRWDGGLLGRDAEGQATVPGGLASVAQVSSGGYHTCALKTDGTVVCWGYNDDGQVPCRADSPRSHR